MDSYGCTLRQHVCPTCGNVSFANDYGWEDCLPCKNEAFAVAMRCAWVKPLSSKFPPGVVGNINSDGISCGAMSFLLPSGNVYKEFRRRYLRIMLLGPNMPHCGLTPLRRHSGILYHPVSPTLPSPFRKLTWMTNGLAGSIRGREDAIDHVLEFLYGVDCSCFCFCFRSHHFCVCMTEWFLLLSITPPGMAMASPMCKCGPSVIESRFVLAASCFKSKKESMLCIHW